MNGESERVKGRKGKEEKRREIVEKTVVNNTQPAQPPYHARQSDTATSARSGGHHGLPPRAVRVRRPTLVAPTIRRSQTRRRRRPRPPASGEALAAGPVAALAATIIRLPGIPPVMPPVAVRHRCWGIAVGVKRRWVGRGGRCAAVKWRRARRRRPDGTNGCSCRRLWSAISEREKEAAREREIERNRDKDIAKAENEGQRK